VYRGPVYLRFAGSLILSNSANLILPGGVNITVAAGDTCTVMPKATTGVSDGWIVTEYTRAALSPPVVGYAQAGANSDIVSLANLVSIQGGQLAGFRNKLIGGHFDTNPWQLGTSITVTATDTYVADQWKIQFDGTVNITVAKAALAAPAVINGVWCAYGLKITVNSKAGNTFMRLVQCIEDVDTATTMPVVLQSAVQGSASFAVACNLRQNFGLGGSPSASVATPFTTTLGVTSSMQWLQTGATLPTIAGKTLGTTAASSYVAVEYDLLNVPVSGYLHIALSGMEQGLYASVWEDRRRVEPSLCLRYLQMYTGASGITGIGAGRQTNTTRSRITIPLLGLMKSIITVTFGGGVIIDIAGANPAGTIFAGYTSNNSAMFDIDHAANGAVGQGAVIQILNGAANFVKISAQF
jgi:hypothetical protein